jgi:uncharacterized protein YbaA (DUF1428 family)
MPYVDGYVLALRKKDVPAYRKLARLACKVWMEHGALQYVETIGDDLAVHHGMPFTKAYRIKPAETVAFAWIAYRSRAHRDRVNAKVMADPRLKKALKPGAKMPFDMKRMSHGGFKAIVSAEK